MKSQIPLKLLLGLLVFVLLNVSAGCSRGSSTPSTPTPAPTPEPSPGHLVIQLTHPFIETRVDSRWIEANTDTYSAYVYSGNKVLVANAVTGDTNITLDADAGTYKVVLLAGSADQSKQVSLLAAGEKSAVTLTENETTTISVELQPVQLEITSLPVAEIGRTFHATMYGSLPLSGLKIAQAPSVTLGTGNSVEMLASASGMDWSAQAQLSAPATATSKSLSYQGGLLALQDTVLGEQLLNLGDYRWILFTGKVSPFASEFSQTINFKSFTTVCSSGCDYSSIQTAIDAASDNDHIAVRPGTYSENLVIDKPLTLHGATWDLIKERNYPVPDNYAWDTSVESLIVVPDSNTDGITVDISNLGKAGFNGNVSFKGFVVHSLTTLTSNRHLLRVYAHDANLDNIEISNNIIGPNTNSSDPANYGRMGLYLVPYYGNYAITNSMISHNKIFASGGNGDNIFVWGGYIGHPIADLSGTVIENNDIYGSRRSGIEIAGSAKNLTIRYNRIHDNGFSGDDAQASDYKYGNGIAFIRVGSESGDANALPIDSMNINGNRIYNNKKFGIYLGPMNTNHSINDNDVYNNGWDGIRVDLDEVYHLNTNDAGVKAPGVTAPVYNIAYNISFQYNNVYGNGFGAKVIGTPSNGFMLNAAYNWWGADSGPAPVGAGDDVSNNVTSSNYSGVRLN